VEGVEPTISDRDEEVEELEELRARVAQLQHALESRVVIEQAKGVLSERFKLPIEEAFLLLRYAARSSQKNIHEVSARIVAGGPTPNYVTLARTREQRWRAAGQRERAEAQREKARHEQERVERLQRVFAKRAADRARRPQEPGDST
jgi:hypothetical protein